MRTASLNNKSAKVASARISIPALSSEKWTMSNPSAPIATPNPTNSIGPVINDRSTSREINP